MADYYAFYRCNAHGWYCYGHECPTCHPPARPINPVPFQIEFEKMLRRQVGNTSAPQLEKHST